MDHQRPITSAAAALEPVDEGSAALLRNVQVLRVAAFLLVALNIVHVVVFGWIDEASPARAAWAAQIVAAHGLMALVMTGVGLLARRGPTRAWSLRGLPEGVATLVLVWAIGLTVADQAVTSGVSAFVNACFAMVIVLQLRPWVAASLLVSAWLFTTNLMNAATAASRRRWWRPSRGAGRRRTIVCSGR